MFPTRFKELGQGFYSKVYLAQDYKNGFVALKTVDNQRNVNSEECISNEIDILATLGAHLNIVKLLGNYIFDSMCVTKKNLP